MEKAIVFIGDNNFDKNVGGRLIRPNGGENTYKTRILRDGKEYKILKNYFSKKELFGIFKNFSENFTENRIFYGEKFWFVNYVLSKPDESLEK
ncbi:hypothetical protein HYU13_01935 [Candidatus Woesearchaeota archaeon]|nr:hypothetical protein [Candidatus Woesearchaeota archaeon]